MARHRVEYAVRSAKRPKALGVLPACRARQSEIQRAGLDIRYAGTSILIVPFFSMVIAVVIIAVPTSLGHH